MLSSIWEKISSVGEKIEEAAERAWSEIKEHIPRPQPPPQPPPSQPPPSSASPPPVSAKPPERMLTSPIMRGAERVAKKIESRLEKPIAWLEERSKIRGEPLSGYGAKFAKGMLLSVPHTIEFVGVVPYVALRSSSPSNCEQLSSLPFIAYKSHSALHRLLT